jgi:hypothetical protein
MKMKKIIILMVLGSFFLACKTIQPSVNTHVVDLSGVLQKPGMTTYQYGTHVLTSEGKRYALKSGTVNLDNYVDKKVKIKGTKVEGYPVENGPELLEVTDIK